MLETTEPSQSNLFSDLVELWKVHHVSVTISPLTQEEITPNPRDIDPSTKQPRVIIQPVLYFKTKAETEFPRG